MLRLFGRLSRWWNPKRVSAAATVVVAVAAFNIPVILDYQQQETLAKNSTIEYFRSLFNSANGRLLDAVATEAEIFIWRKRMSKPRENNGNVPPEKISSPETKISLLEIDDQLINHLEGEYLKNNRLNQHDVDIPALTVFLLKTADLVYECANFREIFEDASIKGEYLERGAIKFDRPGRLVDTRKDYLDIIWDFLKGLWGARSVQPQCHRESIIKVFGRQLLDAFWYLRRFLYCDKFIGDSYFHDKFSDSSPLYRLESIVMVVEQTDLEERFPDRNYAVMRTFAQKERYETFHPGFKVHNVRLNVDEPGAECRPKAGTNSPD